MDVRTGPADAAAVTTAERIRALSARLLRDAATVDTSGTLPADHLDGLAEAGLYGIFAPRAADGLGLSAAETYAAVEELASACLATTFVWIQHFGLVAALLNPATPEELRTALLPGVVSGRVRGGVALAGLLPGPPRLTATPVSGGWQLDGEAPWATGWGYTGILRTAARGPDDTVVTLLLDATAQPGLTVTPLQLIAANASATVRLGFTGLFVPDARCVGQEPYDPARQQAEGLRANGSLALGVASRCCRLIGPSALDAELSHARDALDAADTAAMPAARAQASELAARAAQALAVHRGSQSALAGDDAGRLAREASFLLVFGSRPAIKTELLGRLGVTR